MKRSHQPHQPVHVLQRGNNKSPVFFGPEDARLYREWLSQTARAEGVAIHAYALMSNHIHLLATATTPAGLGRCMQSVGIRYTRYINGAKGRTGTLWDGPYRAATISDGRYILTCSRYIELNPMRGGIAATAGAYRWSSYRANAEGHIDALITPHPAYVALGSTPEARANAYRALFGETIPDATLNAIRSATNSGAELSADYAPRPRGRPRRTD